ncbi:MAG: terminase [Planctomycetia bacterium]|nr:terminase [Planctomycetia bacterium]MCC7315706.1 terminase [Planctomycetota bacterium]
MTRVASSRRGKAKRNSKAKPKRAVATSPSSILSEFGSIPGYDPIATAGDCRFDVLSARLAVDFFTECLTFTAGEWRGAPFTLQPWQSAIVANIFGWKRPDGLRRYREVFIYVPRKCGKALAVDTPIPTPDGWKQMGDIDEGDLVFDENGLPTLVTHAYVVQHVRPCYRVSFSDGTSIIADADHLWTVDDRYSGRRIVSTEWMAGRLRCGHRQTHREHRFSIPVAGPLHTRPITLPVDPYTLGVWLGNGNSYAANITSHAEDVESYVASIGRTAYPLKKSTPAPDGRRSATLLFEGLFADLRVAGLIQNKHIPRAYLRASINQRLALLQGLMDTDGYCSKRGHCEFTTTTHRIHEGVLELLRSLGMKPTWSVGRAMLNEKDCGPNWRIRFSPRADLPVFRVPRKAQRVITQRKVARRSMTRQIVAIEPVESVPVRCITVDSPSRLYLAGEGMVATHNSEMAGGLGNLLTFADGEPAAQTYCAAADREQARLVFNAAKTMVLAEPELASRSKCYTNAIVVESTGSVLKVISAEAYSKHGINAHGIIVDELHAQPDRELVDVLMTSTGARRQPLVIYITTADFDRPSICNEKYDYAVKVRDGIIEDPAFLPVIYEAKQDDDWTDPEVWAKANPNLGISVSMEYLERECRRARETPSYENTFKRLHLNMKTQQDVRWLSMETWDACGKLKFDESSLEGERCFAGLDLSTTTDISAFVMVFPREDGQVALIPRFWIPAESAEKRERRDRVPYTTWARQGYIEMTSGNVVDYDTIRARLNELKERFNIAEIAIDPWNATQLSIQLQGDGFEVVTFGQGFKDMTAPSKELEKLVMSDKLRHGGHPVLRWMASNVAVETDAAGNLKPSKKKSTERIDGIVATVMGLGRAVLDEGEFIPGVYVVEWS